MRIFFIGTVEFSRKALEKLIDLNIKVIGVATKKESSFHSDFADLHEVCVKHDIPCRFIDDINSEEALNWISGLDPDFIFCFGWSFLLKSKILSIPCGGTIGYHPASLPKNRGRHPLIWALALGLKQSSSTFFFIDEGVDSGDILSQEQFEIRYEDDAKSLKQRVHKIALKQIEDFIPKLINRTYHRVPQDHAKANIWRKRGIRDGEIDFRMSTQAIYNLVRALTMPYVGAHVIYKDKEIKIWRAKEVEINMSNIEYGKVLAVQGNAVLVKCYDNAILLTEHEFEELPRVGDYLH